MSDQLLNAVRRVQANIVNNPKSFRREQQTINSLIYPILDALGWHTQDHKRVRHQYRSDDGDVDFALLYEEDPIVFLEAKPLDTKFSEKEEKQLRRYCNDEEVQIGILTNGAEWHLYLPIQKRLSTKHQKILSITLGQNDQEARSAAELLSLFAYESIGELDTKLIPILMRKYWQEIGKEKLLTEYTRIFRKHFGEWIGLSTRDVSKSDAEDLLREMIALELQPPQAPPNQTPKPTPSRKPPSPLPDTGRVVVLNKEHYPVKFAYEILLQTAEWLVKQNKLNREVCSILPGEKSKKRYLIHTQPIHKSGLPFKRPKQLSNGLYLEVNYSQGKSIRLAYDLLDRYSYPSSTLRLIGFDD